MIGPWLILSTLLAAPGEPDTVPRAPLARAAFQPDAKTEALAEYGLGHLKLKRGEVPQAIKNLEAAVRAQPDAPAPRKDLIQAYLQVGRDAAAMRIAREVFAADPTDVDTGHLLGRLLFETARYQDAAEVLSQAAQSPQLKDRATKRLAVLRDLARSREMGDDPRATAKDLQTTITFLDTDRKPLLNEGFTPKELAQQTLDLQERLGRALAKVGDREAAQAAFQTAHRLATDAESAPDPATAARLDDHLAFLAEQLGDSRTALVHLERYLQSQPRGHEPYERYIRLLRATGQGQTVLAALDRQARANPTNAAISWLRAIEMLPSEFQAGHKLIEEWIHETPDPAFFRTVVHAYRAQQRAELLLNLVDQLYQRARPDEEEMDTIIVDRRTAGEQARLMAEAIHQDTQVLPLLLRQANVEAQRGRKRRPETLELLVWEAERTGRLFDAEALLRSAVQGPAADKIHVPRALLRLLANQRRWQDVINECDAGMRRNKVFFIYYFWKAEAQAELGQSTAALRTINGILKDAAFHGRRQRVRILGILERYAEMADECQSIMKEFTAPDELHMMRFLQADAYQGLGEFLKAEQVLRELLEEDPDDILALNNLGYNLADQGRKLDEAEALIRRAVDLDRDERARSGDPQPESSAYLDSLGWVLFRKGQLDQAQRCLERASQDPIGANDPTIWDHLGDVYFRQEQPDKAKKAWETAESLYTDSHQGRQHGRLKEVQEKLRIVNE